MNECINTECCLARGGEKQDLASDFIFSAFFSPSGVVGTAEGLRGDGMWGLRQLCFKVAVGIPWDRAWRIPKKAVASR